MNLFCLILILIPLNFLFGVFVLKKCLDRTTKEHSNRILQWFNCDITGDKITDKIIKFCVILSWPLIIYLFDKSFRES
jgi:hypothetical protein